MSTPSQGFPLPLGMQLSGFHGDVSMGSPNGTQSSDDSDILYPTNWPLAEEFYDFEPHQSDPPLGTSTESSPVGPSTPAPRHTSSAIPQPRTPLNNLEAQILGIVPPSTGRSQPSRANPDPRTREIRTFYDISLLTERPDRYPEQVHIAMLRRKWKQKFLESSVGKWDYVEYVPPWTDPDWDQRYIYIEGANSDLNGPVTAQYAKPGLLQTHRPALLPGDEQYKPSDAAKRFGFYPWERKTEANEDPSGKSGTTPTRARSSDVPLENPLADGRNSVTLDNLQAEREFYDQECQGRGQASTDAGFRDAIQSKEQTEYTRALLYLFDFVVPWKEREEYQRFLFNGNTTNELVDRKAWTMDVDADTDVAFPLHDLVKRDKWASSVYLGYSELAPKVVYNISGKQGEFAASDATLWNAMQPALQLVSRVLACNHPFTWLWADIRKLRPIRGSRDSIRHQSEEEQELTKEDLDSGIDRKNLFAIWPEFSGLEDDLDMVSSNWEEMKQLCRAGFDSTRYVCGILERTIEWSIMPAFRANDVEQFNRVYGSTTLVEECEDPPFKIRIEIAADYIWQLLVDEYSGAEKASATFVVAATMLHELAHALCMARLQMSQPNWDEPLPKSKPDPNSSAQQTADAGQEEACSLPLWLRLNPKWQQELADFSASKGIDVLRLLQLHGRRWFLDFYRYRLYGIIWPRRETFFEDQPYAEEGWATEQGYFGGVIETSIGKSSSYEVEATRFLDDIAVMPGMRPWATAPLTETRAAMIGLLSRDQYLKFFKKDFWEHEVARVGVGALKINQEHLPALFEWESFKWRHATAHFGEPAANWMQFAWKRLSGDTDYEFLWRWLYYKTVIAAEPSTVSTAWFAARSWWRTTDFAAFSLREVVEDSHVEMVEAITNVRAEPEDNPDLPAAEIKAFFSAVSEMLGRFNTEATWCQNFAAGFVRLSETPEKVDIFNRYHDVMGTRMDLVYIDSIRTVISCLDDFDLRDESPVDEEVLMRIQEDTTLNILVNQQRHHLKTRLQICQGFFEVVRDIFDADAQKRNDAADRLGAVPSGGTHTLAQRLSKMARAQYNRLRPDDPRKNVAHQWESILQAGDAHRSPVPGSQAANDNAMLQNIAANITASVERQIQMLIDEFPDPEGNQQDPGTALQGRQTPSGRLRSPRVFDADDQRLMAQASGFWPYTEPATGFTHYQNLRNQQPDEQGNDDNDDANAQLAAATMGLLGDDTEADLDARISYLENQLREAERGGGNGSGGLAVPRPGQSAAARGPWPPPSFGGNAALQSEALQDLEDTILRRSAARRLTNAGGGSPSRPSRTAPGQSFSSPVLENGYRNHQNQQLPDSGLGPAASGAREEGRGGGRPGPIRRLLFGPSRRHEGGGFPYGSNRRGSGSGSGSGAGAGAGAGAGSGT